MPFFGVASLLQFAALSLTPSPQTEKLRSPDSPYRIVDSTSTDGELSKIAIPLSVDRVDLVSARCAGPLTIKAIANGRSLRELTVGLDFTDDGLTQVSQIESLERLVVLANRHCTDKSGSRLGSIKQLRELTLLCPNTSDETIVALSGCLELTKLIANSKATDRGIAAISNLSKLEVLTLTGAKCTKNGFRYLARLNELRHLGMLDCRIDNESLVSTLKALPKLRSLYLRAPDPSDEAFAQALENKKIAKARLCGCRVGPKTVAALNKSPSLELLAIDRHRLSDTQEKELRMAHPKMEIVFK